MDRERGTRLLAEVGRMSNTSRTPCIRELGNAWPRRSEAKSARFRRGGKMGTALLFHASLAFAERGAATGSGKRKCEHLSRGVAAISSAAINRVHEARPTTARSMLSIIRPGLGN